MTPDRWRKSEELYHSARKREENERIAFLNEACVASEALRQEIEPLLAEEKEPQGFLESPAFNGKHNCWPYSTTPTSRQFIALSNPTACVIW